MLASTASISFCDSCVLEGCALDVGLFRYGDGPAGAAAAFATAAAGALAGAKALCGGPAASGWGCEEQAVRQVTVNRWNRDGLGRGKSAVLTCRDWRSVGVSPRGEFDHRHTAGCSAGKEPPHTEERREHSGAHVVCSPKKVWCEETSQARST